MYEKTVAHSFTVKQLILLAVSLHEVDIHDEAGDQKVLRSELRSILKKRLPDYQYERLFSEYDRADELAEAEARVRELTAA